MIFFKVSLAIFLSFFFIKLISNNASKLGLIDVPNERSSHIVHTPRGAGIGFGGGFFISSLVFWDFFLENWLIYLSLFLVFLIGILDDHKDAKPKTKFYVIFFATVLLFLDDVYISSLGQYFGFELSLWYLALPFSMFALAGFTNALNLIDGIDGLAGTISLIILTTFFYLGYRFEDQFIQIVSLLLIVSLIPFMYFNWNPAKIFMGDSGSLFLGFGISIIAVCLLKYIHPIAIFYLTAIPILDTIIVMTRRIKKGFSPFSPDKTHIHHILLKFFYGNVIKSVLFLSLMQFLFSICGVMIAIHSTELGKSVGSIFALLSFIGITILFYIIFTGMHKRQKYIEKITKRAQRRKKN